MGQLSPDGLPARLVLAILESADILYAGIGPVIVTGLPRSAGFTADAVGYVFSSSMYGTAIGGFPIIFVAHRLNWRRAATSLWIGGPAALIVAW